MRKTFFLAIFIFFSLIFTANQAMAACPAGCVYSSDCTSASGCSSPYCWGSYGYYTCQSVKAPNGSYTATADQCSSGSRNSAGQCIASSGGSSTVCPPNQICNPLKYGSFEQLLSGVSNFVFKVALVLAPLMLIIAGLMWVTSAGDTKRLATAKNIALYTIIGLAVILLASGLVAVLKSIIGYTG